MFCKIITKYPAGEPGFVEYKRAFTVRGNFVSDDIIPDNAILTVSLADQNGNIVRRVVSDRKNKSIFKYNPDLTVYSEELDPGRALLEKFGVPELVVEDTAHPEETMNRASVKCIYSDKEFKAIIVSASDKQHGAIFDDGINFVDDDGKPFYLLEEGNYKLRVELEFDGEVLGESEKNIIIGRRDNQLICRFNPKNHKDKIVEWSASKGFSAIIEPLPGYVDAYLGEWLYHMGLLKMYRANDIALFETANIRMFVYLIDPASTSYETELAYLQTQNVIESDRFHAYYYDIGEALIGHNTRFEQEGKIIEFSPNEYMSVCRVDVVNGDADENTYFINGKNVLLSITNIQNIPVTAGSTIAITGVLKPWQMNPNEFVLRDDNTYEILNAPEKMSYIFTSGNETHSFERFTGMERIDEKNIGASVYEFYNLFYIDKSWSGKTFNVDISCIDRKGNISPAKSKVQIKVI